MSPYTFEYIIDHICSIGNVVAAIQTTIPKKTKRKKILHAFLGTIHLCTVASVIEFNIL